MGDANLPTPGPLSRALAFREGPVVLAALRDGPVSLKGSADSLIQQFQPQAELMWEDWFNEFQLQGQDPILTFKPLYEIGEEAYTVYCSVR